MILRVSRIRVVSQWLVGALVAVALLIPMGVSASNQSKSAPKAKKPEVSKVADKKKASSARASSRQSTAQAAQKRQPGKASQTVAKGKTSRDASSRKVAVQSGQTVRNSRIADARRSKQQAKNNVKNQSGKKTLVARERGQGKAKVALVAHNRPAPAAPVVLEPRLSNGERLGLRESHDALELNSSVALVVDQDTSEVLFSKNDKAVLPIASLTKLMTGLVIADANLPMDELITITEDDAAVYRNSRLGVGTQLSRGELMHLALMSSENRAANALGRTFPGGSNQFVRLMNAKAVELGMHDTRYVEPTGLSSQNQSSARDLATLVSVSYQRQILRDLSTSPSHQLDLGNRTLQFNNSNRLVRNPEWEIGLQKTGFIAAAGRCLVMQAKVAGRKVIMVFLDSAGKLSRLQDAERVRRWVEAQRYQQYFVSPQG